MSKEPQTTESDDLTIAYMYAYERSKPEIRRATILECADAIMSHHDGVLCDNEMSLKLRSMATTLA